MKKKLCSFTAVVLFFLLFSLPASAGVEEDISDIKRELSQLKREVSEIKSMIKKIVNPQKKPSLPVEAEVNIDDDPIMGKKDAPVTIVEFSDYQCPYCARFSREVLPGIKKEYITTGKARYVFKDFPLSMHRFAQHAAEAANCANDQGKYWNMHDDLFKNSNRLNKEVIKEIADGLKLNMNTFNKCLADKKYSDEVKKDINEGIQATVRGTPSFIIGKTNTNGKVKGRIIRGVLPLSAFKAQIDKLLAQ